MEQTGGSRAQAIDRKYPEKGRASGNPFFRQGGENMVGDREISQITIKGQTLFGMGRFKKVTQSDLLSTGKFCSKKRKGKEKLSCCRRIEHVSVHHKMWA